MAKKSKKKSKKSQELKKVGVISLAKIAGLFGVIYGLLAGILFAFVFSQLGSSPQMTQQLGMITQLGYSVIAILPIIYGILYFIVGAITALIYNLIAKQIGGVEVRLE